MTAAVEQIRKAIRSLAPDEIEELLMELRHDFPAASIEAEWNAEIDLRVKEVEEGGVELVSGEEFNRHVDRLFAGKGLVRRA
ncbi:MAG TPA: addiction module protein [Bacteroidia bacterium]|nr:addiction module protein [Bacteroidia bacterium]